jgi:hypothetical protein
MDQHDVDLLRAALGTIGQYLPGQPRANKKPTVDELFSVATILRDAIMKLQQSPPRH